MITTVEPNQYAPTPYLWTSEEYQRLAETGVLSGRRIELIEGQVLQMSPMGSRHSVTLMKLVRLLPQKFNESYSIQIQSPLALSRHSQPEPDAAVLLGPPSDFREELPIKAVLTIEVADSTLRFDRTTKAKIYAAAGIEDYWIINLSEDQVEVHRKPTPEDGYAETIIAKGGEKISPLVLPDAQIAVSDLLP